MEVFGRGALWADFVFSDSEWAKPLPDEKRFSVQLANCDLSLDFWLFSIIRPLLGPWFHIFVYTLVV